jgi:hypothetical protein
MAVRSGGDRLCCGATRQRPLSTGMLRFIRVRRRKQCFVLRRLPSFVIDAGRTFVIGRPTWVWSRGKGLNLRLLVDRQHEAVGSRYGIGDTRRRQFPAASRGGCHLAQSRRDTSRCSWGSLFRSGRFSRPEEILRLGLSPVAALASITPWFCFWPNFAVRSDAHQNPSCSNWNYLGRRSIVLDGARPL